MTPVLDKFCALLTGAMYGGGSDLFYSQFDLHTRDQKRSQIILLEVKDSVKVYLDKPQCFSELSESTF